MIVMVIISNYHIPLSSDSIPKEALEGEGEEPKPTDPEDELTEDEEIIKASLAYGDPLSSDILDNILPGWWNEEPFRYSYVLFLLLLLLYL